MKRYFVSAVALGAALGFAAPAWAQSEIGGQPIGPDDLPLVEEHCQALWDADQDDAAPVDDAAPADDPAVDDPAVDDADPGMEAPEVDAPEAPDGELGAESIDLTAITYEDCEAAGFFVEADVEPLPAEPLDVPAENGADEEVPVE